MKGVPEDNGYKYNFNQVEGEVESRMTRPRMPLAAATALPLEGAKLEGVMIKQNGGFSKWAYHGVAEGLQGMEFGTSELTCGPIRKLL